MFPARTTRPHRPSMPVRHPLIAVLAVGLLAAGFVGCSSDDGSDDAGSSVATTSPPTEVLPYATAGWSTLHGDPGNRKYQPAATGADAYDSWQALENTSVLAAPSSGTDGELFVTTGLPEGQSNLHAFAHDGTLLWESDPWSGATGVDPCALLNTPVVDVDGDLYVSDCDQVWAFHPDGDVKWTTDLPAPPADNAFADNPLRPNNFVTAALLPGGELVGITIFGQVVALDRATGEATSAPLELPSVPSARAEDPPLPPGALGNGEVDPQMIDLIWQVAFGGSVVSANTPAVSSDGRLFVVAGGDDPRSGVVYGIDVVDGEPTIAFQTPVGVGSGCSPTLSPDEAYAYTCDAAGALYSVATDDGEVQWTVEDAGSEAGSVAVGPEGNIYLLVRNGSYRAFDSDGELLWDADFTTLPDPLPDNDAVGPKTFIGGGNPTVIDDGGSLVVALNRSYQFEIAGRTPNIPVLAELVELDAETGQALAHAGRAVQSDRGHHPRRPGRHDRVEPGGDHHELAGLTVTDDQPAADRRPHRHPARRRPPGLPSELTGNRRRRRPGRPEISVTGVARLSASGLRPSVPAPVEKGRRSALSAHSGPSGGGRTDRGPTRGGGGGRTRPRRPASPLLRSRSRPDRAPRQPGRHRPGRSPPAHRDGRRPPRAPRRTDGRGRPDRAGSRRGGSGSWGRRRSSRSPPGARAAPPAVDVGCRASR